jgi:NADH-quinone oxidoreductase subunit A
LKLNTIFACLQIVKMLLASQILVFLPIVMMFLVALGFVGLVMGVTHWMGPHHKSKTKLETFECGIDVQGNARTPFSIKYFLVAILFVLFDVEVIFMYPWAVNFRQLGLLGIIEMFSFIAVFLVGFFYIIKKGALKWE